MIIHGVPVVTFRRSEEHTSELQSHDNLVCRLLLEKKKKNNKQTTTTEITRPHTRKTHTCTALVCALLRPSSLIYGLVLFDLFSCFFFFFLNDGAPPEFSPFPLPAPFPT